VTARYWLSQAAIADIDSILEWSGTRFGESARRRYAALIASAIRDVAHDPYGVGTHPRPELGEGVRSWHLRQSRGHAIGKPVQRPRHFLIYRLDGTVLIIGRVLYDSMELERQIDPTSTWEPHH
jgi:toxin ParE1/3/4